MIRTGVIGVGHLGRLHARVYTEIESCRLEGVYDVDADAAGRVAQASGCRVYESAERLLDAVDAVSIAVPTSAHREVAGLAIERGVHALVEKPIASTVEGARELVAAAKRRGVVLAVGHIERMNPAVRAALKVLRDPRFIEVHRLGVFVPRGTDVAVILDLMIHDIDLILSTVKSPVSMIDAVGVPVLSPSIDIANARLRFENGCVANVTASRVSREKVRKIRFFQPDGYLSVDTLTPRAQLFRRRDVPVETLRRIATGEIEGGLEDIVEHIELELDGREPLRVELESFLDAASSGGTPDVSGEDGLRALEVAMEILTQIKSVPGPDAGS
jgi:predicted dehydrogenase